MGFPVVEVLSGGVPATEVANGPVCIVGTSGLPITWVSSGGIPLTKGGWRPDMLGPSLLGWWSAAHAELITQSSGLVTSWRDFVAGYDAVASTTARPTYSDEGFGSLPGVAFDGVANCMTLASQPFPDADDPCEIWALVQQNSIPADTADKSILSYGGSGTSTARALRRTVVSGVNRGRAAVGNGSTALVFSETTIDLSNRHILRGQIGATQSFLTVDSAAPVGPLAAVPATGSERVRIGAGSSTAPSAFFNGVISDILVTAPLSSLQAASLARYLQAKIDQSELLSSEGDLLLSSSDWMEA